ncbi:hypothetical protein AT728_26715 [Streptomyces silvensis]|uniref:Uncharacterized protein n=1 Tax=Streptomyces silvensis TaxID=1765722 RepID=A0A0W7WX34_9ACTN|nr:hypothetical protein AT728_26715 [Streptomyces silvensis]
MAVVVLAVCGSILALLWIGGPRALDAVSQTVGLVAAIVTLATVIGGVAVPRCRCRNRRRQRRR